MRFYFGSGSPWAWRVQLVLEEKGIRYEPTQLSFSAGDHKKPEFVKMNPHGKVPVLVDGATVLYESQPILEYLEERHPAPPLLPADPAGRAAVRIEESEATLYFFEVLGTVVRHVFFTPADQRDPAKVAEARDRARAELDRLETRATSRNASFVLGETLSRADTTWLPFIELAVRGGVALDASSWIAAWRERMHRRPSFDPTYPPHWRTAPRPA